LSSGISLGGGKGATIMSVRYCRVSGAATFCLVFSVVMGVGRPLSADRFFQPIVPPRPVQVMAHRGVMSAAPENTLAAFGLAVELGFEWIEVDVRLTSDGDHVLFHDPNLDDNSNGTGPLKEHTLEEIRKLDAGGWFARRFEGEKIPTLAETLAFAKDKINLYLDCKDVDVVKLVREIRRSGMERQVVVFGEYRLLKQVHHLSDGAVAVMPDYDDRPDLDFLIQQLHPVAIEFEFDLLTPEIVTRAHAAGIIVQSDSLGEADNPAAWRKAMEMGVDWIQTDCGERVIATAAQCTLPSPRPVMIVAHRGVNRLAPENTLAAFRKAIELDMDYMEVDLHTSSDGQLVAIHDGRLERTTNGSGPVRSHTLAELKVLSAGAWFGAPYARETMPTMEEVVELARGKIKLYIDAKDVDPVLLTGLIRAAGLEKDVAIYGGVGLLREIARHAPELRTMPPLHDPTKMEQLARKLHPYAFDVPWETLSEDLIRRCHDLDIKVFSDALGKNERAPEYRKAINWGIDAIQTDYPLRVITVLMQRTAQYQP
jgi:glycerophosphoryl diester phosphodiesterase